MEQLITWLGNKLQNMGLRGRIHNDLIRQDAEWYYVPIYVDMGDVYDKATTLQQIEEDWETEAVQPGHNLLLIPAVP